MTQAKQTRKLLVIGIDGGTLDIVYPLVRRGELPNLGRLLNSGSHGTLLSTIPPVSAAAWSSFITGTNPGRHGVFLFFRKERNNCGKREPVTLVNSRHIRGTPFWRVLNEHGIKVGLVNIPLTYPPEQVDRFMISGMLVPQGSDNYVYPPEVLSKLDNYSVDIEGLMVQNKWRCKQLIEQSREMFVRNVFNLSRTRAHNALKLMKSEPWDLFMVVFTGCDRISHFFWEDNNNGQSPSSIVEDYYISLDSLIGKLVEEAGRDAFKLVMSDHGFGPAPTRRVNAYVLSKLLGETSFVAGHHLLHLRNRLMARMGMERQVSAEDFVNLKRTKIFLKPMYANFMGIYINTRETNGCGTVSRGEEYRTLRDRIVKKMEDLADPVFGVRLAEKIHLRESLYEGSSSNDIPDIVVQFPPDYRVSFSPRKSALVYEQKDPIRTGEHTREGLFIASGPQLESGRLKRDLLIQDLTPTMLYLLGAPIPTDYDGALITELFSDNYLAKNPPLYEDVGSRTKGDSGRFNDDSREDDEESKKFLKSLGYM